METKTYHHGDLRAALIEAGMALLAEREADTLGLREVARAVGVSATAVYRHFPDKGALLGAMAREGLQRLGAAQAEAGKQGFGAIVRSYRWDISRLSDTVETVSVVGWSCTSP